MKKIAQTIAQTELKTLILPLFYDIYYAYIIKVHNKPKYNHIKLHYWWLIALSNYGVGTII